jgi:nucleoside-diphosphate-sugar epimerase
VKKRTILVTGGGGYIGSVLCPKLLKQGHKVRVLDLMIYDCQSLDFCRTFQDFELIRGDIRDNKAVSQVMRGVDTVIHLAAITYPMGELEENLIKSINYDAVKQLIDVAKASNVERFINASTASVYGINLQEDADENSHCLPVNLYGKYKLAAEKLVHQAGTDDFIVVSVRPATTCGFSFRQRFDLIINMMICQALTKDSITVFGGNQRRPHTTIQDITNLYTELLLIDKEKISGEVFNVGFENMKVLQTAYLVQDVIGEYFNKKIDIIIEDVTDLRDYHISSEKLKTRLNFYPKYTVKDAIIELVQRFNEGNFPDTEYDKYYNVRKLKIENIQ